MQRMTETVKPRAARTRATRRRIVDAAAELFVAEGYGTTTLEQIAKRAGVAVQTVYFHFGNKRTLLREAVDVAAVGDDEQVALLERPWIEEIRAERDPRRLIALWAALAASELPSEHYEFHHGLRVTLETPDAELRWLKGEDIFAGVARESPGDANANAHNQRIIANLVAGALGKEFPS